MTNDLSRLGGSQKSEVHGEVWVGEDCPHCEVISSTNRHGRSGGVKLLCTVLLKS